MGECSHSKTDRTATVVVAHSIDVDLIPCGMDDRLSAGVLLYMGSYVSVPMSPT